MAKTNPKIAKEWDINKNVNLTPYDVTSGSAKEAWWLCHICGHSWKTKIYSRLDGNGCPSCSGYVVTPSNRLSNNLKLTKEWDTIKNGVLSPDDVVKGSHKEVWWLCHICGHSWKTSVKNRSSGRGCPSCSGKVPTPFNCLATKNKELSLEWHPTKNGKLTPNNITCGSNRKVWWSCHFCGHSWEATVTSRFAGGGCPKCNKSALEKFVGKILEKYKINYEQEKRFLTCKNKFPLPFDFHLQKHNMVIECQGDQHYERVKYFQRTEKDFKERQRIDKIKKDWAINNSLMFIEFNEANKPLIKDVVKIIKKQYTFK